jgi:hypothetical protein
MTAKAAGIHPRDYSKDVLLRRSTCTDVKEPQRRTAGGGTSPPRSPSAVAPGSSRSSAPSDPDGARRPFPRVSTDGYGSGSRRRGSSAAAPYRQASSAASSSAAPVGQSRPARRARFSAVHRRIKLKAPTPTSAPAIPRPASESQRRHHSRVGLQDRHPVGSTCLMRAEHARSLRLIR